MKHEIFSCIGSIVGAAILLYVFLFFASSCKAIYDANEAEKPPWEKGPLHDLITK
jgi:hypothetical protein